MRHRRTFIIRLCLFLSLLYLATFINCTQSPLNLGQSKDKSTSQNSRSTLKGAALVTSLPFQPGTTHWTGRYRFDSSQNYFYEGLSVMNQIGSPAIFVTLDNNYKMNYPGDWGSSPINSLTQLSQTQPFQTAFLNPRINTYVLNTFSFSVGNGIMGLNTSQMPDWESREYNEIYQLTQYLMTAFQGTGKVFILKNWETDWFVQSGYDPNYSLVDPAKIDRITRWFKARQKAVSDARRDFATSGVFVLHAVEVNLIEAAMPGASVPAKKIIDQIVPQVLPDMVSYSSYEATNSGDPVRLQKDLAFIISKIPDNLGLGAKRVFISEYGVLENTLTETQAKNNMDQVLSTAQSFGLSFAFLWQTFDASCSDPSGNVLSESDGVLLPGDSRRPQNKDCFGYWIKKPDGTLSTITIPLMQKYWNR